MKARETQDKIKQLAAHRRIHIYKQEDRVMLWSLRCCMGFQFIQTYSRWV